MGTEVLRPQDCFVERFPVFHGRTKGTCRLGYINANNYINNYAYNKSSMVRTDHKKRNNNKNHQYQQQKDSTKVYSLDDSAKQSHPVATARFSSRNSNNRNELEMGKVSSFRRGGSLDSLNCRIKKERRNGTYFDRADVYAGSACSVSPSPSSLPVPTFFKKQEKLNSFDDSATRDLRRLLRLN